jgi:hypothetical protein
MGLVETEREMDYRKLSNEIVGVVVEALQHFDHIDQKGPPQTFEETQASIAGAVERYMNDRMFRAKVQMLVSRITAVVRDNETPNDRVEGRDAALSRRVPSHDGLCGNGNYNERTDK